MPESSNIEQLYVLMNVPKLYRGKTVANFNGFTDKVNVATLTIESGNSIFFTGQCGTGKTHLAVALMLLWVQKFKPKHSADYPLFLPAVEFFLEVKSTFDGAGNEKEIIDKYSIVPLLVLDDVGAEKVTEWSRQVFYTLIDRRYRMMKQTIITSNLSLDDISKAIDDRITSRLIEMGKVIELNGEDYRLKLHNKNTMGLSF